MQRHSLFAALLGTALLFAATVHAGGGGRGSVPVPRVDVTLIDAPQSVMTIHGHDFGQTTPTVFLGKQPLKVRKNTNQEIIAELPASVKPASYRLVVVSGPPSRVSSTPFFTTITADQE